MAPNGNLLKVMKDNFSVASDLVTVFVQVFVTDISAAHKSSWKTDTLQVSFPLLFRIEKFKTLRRP